MSASQPLRFAINLGNAVLARQTAAGEPAGITVELARRIAADMAKEAQFITYPTAGKVVEDAENGVWDIAFLAVDPKREETLRFTQPYITIQGTALVKAQSPWQSVAQMDKPGVVINVGRGAAYDLYLTRELDHATLNRLSHRRRRLKPFYMVRAIWSPGSASPWRKRRQNTPDTACWRMILCRLPRRFVYRISRMRSITR